ncbi:MAG TPA: ABC-F family ATP-binding cassette domain-containing protein [Patescibacteria group bacterium]|nr:ABC-F family ATP-binding cassette domain-containing protein [Patescibacteria group bacterium]
MNLLSVENLSKNYGVRTLFAGVSFGVDEGDKIGLIGINGTGKSTLLRILASLETADDGRMIAGNGLRTEYLPQNPEFDPEATVLGQVFKGSSAVMQLLQEYEAALLAEQRQPGQEAVQQRLIQLGQQMDAMGAWQLESEAKSILNRLGISDFSARIGTLSGGQKKRVALAGALIQEVDLLLLDEPTNHLDNDTVEWLEQYLLRRRGALIMITHDRYFLDRVTNRMIEIDAGSFYSYAGNYSSYLESKAEREERQESSERKRLNLLRNELAWIRRGAKARSTKQKARIERFEELNAAAPQAGAGRLEIVAGASRLGRKIIALDKVCKAFDGVPVVRDFSYTVLKDDRVGIVGPNGSGKSTLIHLITGRLAPDSGSVDVGQTVKIGWFAQETPPWDEEQRVLECIREVAQYVPDGQGGTISASQMLERFLFPPSLQWTPIGKLSGGERRRLDLLRVLMGAPNVLILDEPANDLDIQTLTILEDYLDGFPGAVLLVSHDRYMLDRLAEKTFAFADGTIRQYAGGYSDYRRQVEVEAEAAGGENAGPLKKNADNRRSEDKPRERPKKFTFQEQKEFAEIDDVIAATENERKVVNQQMEAAGSDFTELQRLIACREELDERLEKLMTRWTYLNELAEEMEQKK